MSATPAPRKSAIRARAPAPPPATIPAPSPSGATPVTIPAPAAVIPAPVIGAPLVDPADSPGVQARINALNERLRAAEAEAAAAPTLRQQLVQEQAARVAAERNAALIGTGIKAPSVQRALRRGYDDYAGEAGESPLPFGEWIEKEAKVDPLFSPHFAAPVATPVVAAPVASAPVVPVVAPVAGTPVAPVVAAPANPNNGTVATPVAQGHIFTDAEVAAMDGATYNLHAAEIQRQMESGAGGVRFIMPKPRAGRA